MWGACVGFVRSSVSPARELAALPIRGAQRYWGTLALNASIELFSSI